MTGTTDITTEKNPFKRVRTGMLRYALVRRTLAGLTGSPDDLRRLTPLIRTPVGTPGLQIFLDRLIRDIELNQGIAMLITRIGKALNPISKRRLIEDLIFNWAYLGQRARIRCSTNDRWYPSFFVISPTMRCNLHCRGCYSGLYEKDGELSEAEIDNILDQARRMGMFFIVISGGEPFIMQNVWMKLWKKYHDIYFLVYTNGTLIDRNTAELLGRLGNVAPCISLEGWEKETDGRRGSGTWKKALPAMDLLRSEGVLFGVSVTYTRENLETVIDRKFVQFCIDRGALFAWYFMFMPVGKDPILDLVPTPEQRLECGREIARLRRELPLFMADFWNDGSAAAGCLAGGRSYFHILNSGRIEPCVFAHFGVDTIRETSLIEAVNSPFFRSIRRRFPYNEQGNLRRPCMIIDNPQVLREVIAEHIVPAGHAGSEDIIRNPATAAWIDEYAAAFARLVDPVWDAETADPDYLWYREGEMFRKLFRFRSPDRPASA